MEPTRPLLLRSISANEDTLKSDSGIDPESLLSLKCNTLKLERFPMPSGIRPSSLFSNKSGVSNFDKEHKEDGIMPVKLLPYIARLRSRVGTEPCRDIPVEVVVVQVYRFHPA
ncbi:hypothetical protein V6N11_016683 [Hibiscus sabdariffa]|uniref:Uncharacterized protein n=1 Tax=Hibiscus sabdariffa TaxID=183260 RepID=A0ABR2TWC0_9ROSI